MNDFDRIINSSNSELIKWVKNWKTVDNKGLTILSAIILEESGEWESIAHSIDDFCAESSSVWDTIKADFYSKYKVADFNGLQLKVALYQSGQSFIGIADHIKLFMWSSILTSVIAVLAIFANIMGPKGLLFLQFCFGIIVFYVIIGVLKKLKAVGQGLTNLY